MALTLSPSKSKGKSAVNGLSRALDLHEEWRTSNAERRKVCPKTFAKADAQQLACREMYAGFAHYLVHEVIISEGNKHVGKHLALGTALDYLSLVLNHAAVRCENADDPEVIRFFTCVHKDSKTASADWMRKLRNIMVRICFARAKESGEEMDHSATPLYRAHLEMIDRAYSLEGSAEVRIWREPSASPVTHWQHTSARRTQAPNASAARTSAAAFSAGV